MLYEGPVKALVKRADTQPSIRTGSALRVRSECICAERSESIPSAFCWYAAPYGKFARSDWPKYFDIFRDDRVFQKKSVLTLSVEDGH